MSDAGRFTDVDWIASHLLCETGLAYQVAYMGDDNAAAEHPMVASSNSGFVNPSSPRSEAFEMVGDPSRDSLLKRRPSLVAIC
jgi:hypothetical protein